MVPVEPAEFAAQLISRLERLKREQDTMSSLEERLQQIQEVCTFFCGGVCACEIAVPLKSVSEVISEYVSCFFRRRRERRQR